MLCGNYLGEYFIISLNYLFYTTIKKISTTLVIPQESQLCCFYVAETPTE